MNNQSPQDGRIFKLLILGALGFLLFQNIFKQNNTPVSKDRPALSLAKAFEGIDPGQASSSAAATGVSPVPGKTPVAGKAPGTNPVNSQAPVAGAASATSVPKTGATAAEATPVAGGESAGEAKAVAETEPIKQAGAVYTEVEALQEEKRLQAEVKKNENDDYSYWARLRIALLHQYIFKDLEVKSRRSGFLGLGPNVNYLPQYEEVTNHSPNKNTEAESVDAQALYQSGDYLWRQSTKGGGLPSREAAWGLEALVHKGRGNSAFLDKSIYIPAEKDLSKVALEGIPTQGFEVVKVGTLRGDIKNPDPRGILDRVNQYYKTKPYSFPFDFPFYPLFNGVVKLLGNQATYSYGLAVLIFAVLTRSTLQPLNKRQYESMKGLTLIQPEMKKIQERYKDKKEPDAQVKMMKEIRALQQRHGVNPATGCILGFIQMPIFFIFVYPLIQNNEPQMELAGATFLWIQSLARPDIPLLVLYGITMFLSFRLSSTPPTDDMQRQQQKIMAFAFPFVLPFFISTYPSAFTMYWTTYNLMSTIFQWRIMKAADPKKNMLKTLMGQDLVATDAASNAATDAVPPRPGKEKKTYEGKALEGRSTSDEQSPLKNDTSLNGTVQNGAAQKASSNGKPKSAENGSVLSPSEAEINKKKKKK